MFSFTGWCLDHFDFKHHEWIRWGLNPQTPVCKTGALPVRATNPCVAGVVGIEPTQIGLEDRCPIPLGDTPTSW